MTTFSILKRLYTMLAGESANKFKSKYEIVLGILGLVEDYEASEHTGKGPKTVNLNLYTNGSDRYYTFDGNVASGDFIEGNIKISGIIPGGTFKGFVLTGTQSNTLEAALILTGSNYSGQAIAIKKGGDGKWIAK